MSEETPYTGKSFAVAADATHTVTVQMERGRTLEGSFGISGEDDTTDFRIEGPNHELAYGEERAQEALSFEMKAQYSGAYTLYFDRKIYRYPSPLQIDLQYRSRWQLGLLDHFACTPANVSSPNSPSSRNLLP